MITRLVVALAVIGASWSAVFAHEGHDHGPELLPPANVLPRGEATSANFELVAIANGAELLIYVDRFSTNAPVENATIEVETPDGPATALAQAGAYHLTAPWLKRQEKSNLIFSVTAGGITDILSLTLNTPGSTTSLVSWIGDRIKIALQPSLLITGLVGLLLGALLMGYARRSVRGISVILVVAGLAIHASELRAQQDNNRSSTNLTTSSLRERAQRLPNGIVFLPKTVQRIFEIRTLLTEVASHQRVVELPGRIIPDPNFSGFVQAAVGGRLSPADGGFPRLGTQVKKGDVLAYVTPPLQAIDVSDMRQRQGELDQQLEIVERRVGRYEKLAPSGAIALSQLEEARLELQGLKDRRNALDKSRREPEALLAPVSGVIAAGTPVAGQMAQPNAVIFHIVDPAKLWIEALSFEPLGGAETASAVNARGKRLALAYRGAGFADRSQSIPVHFAIEDDASELRAGQLVTILVNTQDQKTGIAVPRSSIVRSTNGQDFVYAHVSAERFEPRAVRVEPLDGERVLILSGIEAGQRIVTQGAELLDHVR